MPKSRKLRWGVFQDAEGKVYSGGQWEDAWQIVEPIELVTQWRPLPTNVGYDSTVGSFFENRKHYDNGLLKMYTNTADQTLTSSTFDVSKYKSLYVYGVITVWIGGGSCNGGIVSNNGDLFRIATSNTDYDTTEPIFADSQKGKYFEQTLDISNISTIALTLTCVHAGAANCIIYLNSLYLK